MNDVIVRRSPRGHKTKAPQSTRTSTTAKWGDEKKPRGYAKILSDSLQICPPGLHPSGCFSTNSKCQGFDNNRFNRAVDTALNAVKKVHSGAEKNPAEFRKYIERDLKQNLRNAFNSSCLCNMGTCKLSTRCQANNVVGMTRIQNFQHFQKNLTSADAYNAKCDKDDQAGRVPRIAIPPLLRQTISNGISPGVPPSVHPDTSEATDQTHQPPAAPAISKLSFAEVVRKEPIVSEVATYITTPSASETHMEDQFPPLSPITATATPVPASQAPPVKEKVAVCKEQPPPSTATLSPPRSMPSPPAVPFVSDTHMEDIPPPLSVAPLTTATATATPVPAPCKEQPPPFTTTPSTQLPCKHSAGMALPHHDLNALLNMVRANARHWNKPCDAIQALAADLMSLAREMVSESESEAANLARKLH